MRLPLCLVLAASACASSVPLATDPGALPPSGEPAPLSGEVTPLVDALASVMGPGSGTRPTPGLDACDEVPEDVSVDGVAYLVSPPRFNGDGTWARLPEVLQLDEDGCGVLARLSKSDAENMRTGLAQILDDGTRAFDGLMLRLVEVEDALWLVSNTWDSAWIIDTDDGSVSTASLPGHIGGAISDGDGGAWMTVLARHDRTASKTALEDHRLVHLDEDLKVVDTIDLPFTPDLGGMGLIQASDLTAGLQSLDLVRAGDRLWVLHSQAAEIAEVDPDDGSSTATTLDVPHPTGLAMRGSEVLLLSGTGTDLGGETVTEPALYELDPSDASLDEIATLTEPDDGWNSWFLDRDGKGGAVGRNVWFDAVEIGDAVLVADPSHHRALLVE